MNPLPSPSSVCATASIVVPSTSLKYSAVSSSGDSGTTVVVIV